MTEKDIKRLKQLLDRADRHEYPKTLDKAILQSSQIGLVQKPSLTPMRFGFFPVSAAIGVTLTIFLFMHIAIIPDPIVAPTPQQNIVFKSRADARQTSASRDYESPDELNKITRDAPPVILPISDARTQILANIDLPNAEQVMQQFALQKIDDIAPLMDAAISDIDMLLKDREFENALRRYQRLRQNCGGCNLPATLEAFAAYANMTGEKKT